MIIQSSDNPRFKFLKKLQQKKYRYQEKKFIIEQDKIVEELVYDNKFPANYKLDEIYIRESSYNDFIAIYGEKLADKKHYILTDRLFKQVSMLGTSKGYLATVAYDDFQLDQIISESKGSNKEKSDHVKVKDLIIACQAIQDPGNLGTIIRVADAVGARALILGKGTVDPFSDKAIRSAMGSIFHLPLIQGDLPELMFTLSNSGYSLIGADMEGKSHLDFLWPDKSCLIMGNEGQGLDPDLLALLDEKISIQMPGSAESLNVAVASGILAFDFLRAR